MTDEEITELFRIYFYNLPQLSYTTSTDASLWLLNKVINNIRVITLTDDDQLAYKCQLIIFPEGLGNDLQVKIESWAETLPLAICGALVQYEEKFRSELEIESGI